MEPEEHILSDFEVELDPANRSLRFVNFIVDRLLFFFFSRAFNIVWGKFLRMALYETDHYTALTINILFALFLYAFFMGLLEGLFRGKTLGKVFTGTRAVNPDGSPISMKTAFLRGLSRVVPLEPFSAFGGDWPRPWHDKWTDTYVIVEKTSVTRG